MPRERQSVTVRVPATTANMGPGFDCIGMALDVWNELTVSRAESFSIIIEGEGHDFLPTSEDNLVVTGLKAAFKAAGKEVPPLKYECKNEIPFSRGMGSSSAAIVSGIVAGLVLAGHELPVSGLEELLQIAAAIEGHPDNVAPAIYGGIQIGLHTGERWYTTRIRLPPGLQTVLFIPDKGCETSEARALLEKKVDRADAIYNMSRVALMIHAFESNNMSELRHATQDKLHQPARCAIIPGMMEIIDASLEAGAHGSFLSGAGPTILAITSGRKGDIYAQRSAERKEKEVAKAMMEAAKAKNVSGRVVVTQPTDRGAWVVRANPPLPVDGTDE
eukprot:TRINITY_DN2598_c0_g2_i1.p1 TRINITY_DN2598_c0_g2~~TRINITY_DN2598_c0_g2_i1.p1  ORF type:complete len:355 (+),score=92.15 TRINITY_DN2598_c0_g2_i1:71-1066(+)